MHISFSILTVESYKIFWMSFCSTPNIAYSAPNYFDLPALILVYTNSSGPPQIMFFIRYYEIFQIVDTKLMWIDKEVAVSGGEVAASGEDGRYFVVSGGEVGVDEVTHVEMYAHQLCSKTKNDVVHINFHPHF